MNPQLNRLSSELNKTAEWAQAIVARIPVPMLGQRPDEKSWSIAECLEHLSLTTDAYLARIVPALEDARKHGYLDHRRTFRVDIAARLLAWWLEPPYKIKSKTSAAFAPRAADTSRSLPDFIDRQRLLQAAIAKANGLALDCIRIASPFANRMKYNVYAAFSLIVAHQRRHLWQAEQVARTIARSKRQS